MVDGDLEARVALLEAREEVRAAVLRYCELNDQVTAVDDLVAMFTEDAQLCNPAGTHDGIDAVRAYYRSFFDRGVDFARHHTMNQVITLEAADTARHEAYFLAMLGKDGESRLAFGRYDDTLVRTRTGWKFRRKVNDVIGMTTLADGWTHGFGDDVRAVR